MFGSLFARGSSRILFSALAAATFSALCFSSPCKAETSLENAMLAADALDPLSACESINDSQTICAAKSGTVYLFQQQITRNLTTPRQTPSDEFGEPNPPTPAPAPIPARRYITIWFF